MDAFAARDAHRVHLSATLTASDNRRRIHLILRDPAGAHGSGVLDLAAEPQRRLQTGATWPEFLADYTTGDSGTLDQQAFGLDLRRAILGADPSLALAWAAIRATAGAGPLDLTVTFGPGTEHFAALPLELLHDDSGYCFSRPGGALKRAFEHYRAADLDWPAAPRVLFAWACPPGAGAVFDPSPHEEALRQQFGGRLTTLARGRRRTGRTARGRAHPAGARQCRGPDADRRGPGRLRRPARRLAGVP